MIYMLSSHGLTQSYFFFFFFSCYLLFFSCCCCWLLLPRLFFFSSFCLKKKKREIWKKKSSMIIFCLHTRIEPKTFFCFVPFLPGFESLLYTLCINIPYKVVDTFVKVLRRLLILFD